MQPKSLKLALALLLVVSLSFAATGCRKKSQSAELGLKPGKANAAPGSATGSGSSTSTSEEPKSPASAGTTPSANGGSNGSGTGGTGSNAGASGGSGGSGSGGSGSGTSGTKPSPTAKGLLVKILWWNDTKTKTPTGCEILYGSSSFKPAVAKDAASGSVGPVPYGKATQLVVYPDGRSGKKILVPIAVDSAMIANSDRDAIHVEISDSKVRVLGNAVDGFDKTFDRF